MQGLVKAAALVSAALAPPVVAATAQPTLLENPWKFLVLTLIYEGLLGAILFVGAITGKLVKNWQDATADAIDLWIRRRLSRYTRRYLRYVKAANRYVEHKGLITRGEFTLEMSDVFIDLYLEAMPLNKLESNPIRTVSTRPSRYSRPITEWLVRCNRENSSLAVIGPPGSGKTTLLRHVAYLLAAGGRRSRAIAGGNKIPIFISLRELKSLSDGGGQFTLVEAIRASLPGLPVPEPKRWVEANLSRGRFALLFDGLDEVPSSEARQRVALWLEEQQRSNEGNPIVVTSRRYGYDENPLSDAIAVQVGPLTDRQIIRFVNSWYLATAARSYGSANDSARLSAELSTAELLARLQQRPGLAELCSNPLLLTMIVNLHYYSGELPGSRHELYRQICEVFLGRRHHARGINVEIPAGRRALVLRHLAYHAMCQQSTEISASEAARIISSPLERVSEGMEPAAFLQLIEQTAGLLVERERGIYAFAHLTLQEYMAAEYICENDLVAELLPHIESTWWRETIRHVAALGDATPIVEACLAHQEDPRMLALAIQCVEEGRELDPRKRATALQIFNPPDVRESKSSRKTAGLARLYLRVGSDMRVLPGRFIGPELTWVEYQCFLDDDPGAFVPDHWVDQVFPAGTQDEPAAGLRYADSLRFLSWLNEQFSGDALFTLPSASEIDRADLLYGHRKGSRPRAFWSSTKEPDEFDGRFGRLLYNRRVSERNVAHPRRNLALAPREVAALAELESEVAPIVPWGNIESDGRTEAEFRTMIDKAISSFTGCEAGALERDLRTGGSLVEQLVTDVLQGSQGDGIQIQVAEILAKMRECAGHCFRRRPADDRFSTSDADQRALLRLAVRDAARICLRISDRPGLDSSLRAVSRRRQAAGMPVVLSIREGSRIIAAALADMYVELLVTEGRLRDAVEPLECIAPLRIANRAMLPVELDWEALMRRHHWNWWVRIGKPTTDRIFAGLLLVLSAPTLIAIALIIRLDGGPALFGQQRVGRAGREFTFYKFRTMVVDADKRSASLLAANEGSGPLFKMRADPRITRVGAWLRRYSIDEIPSLVNVLLGDVSMVGPRPPMPEEVESYNEEALSKLLVKPGLTGLWQISGRSDLSWEDSVRLDLQYVREASLKLDVKIMARTIAVIATGSAF